MSAIKQKEKIKIKNLIILFVAGIINAFGVMIFLFPIRLYDSGISGLSMLLDQITPSYLTISLFLLTLNVPIFIFGYKKQGFIFTAYSVFTVIIYSLFSFLFKFVFKLDITPISPVAGNDILLCAIFGGVISGIGSGLTIRYGGALDGIEVLAVTFAKKIGISIGTFVSIFNFILYIACGIKNQSWILPLYSIIAYYIGSKIVDFVVEGIDKSKCAMIITKDVEEVTKILSENFNSSGTFIEAKGGYLKTDKHILFFVVNHFQINKLKQLVLSVDNEAFISITEVSEVTKNDHKGAR